MLVGLASEKIEDQACGVSQRFLGIRNDEHGTDFSALPSLPCDFEGKTDRLLQGLEINSALLGTDVTEEIHSTDIVGVITWVIDNLRSPP